MINVLNYMNLSILLLDRYGYLQLNVGGTSISVRRSTLTQFPDTLLAATFSDDGMNQWRRIEMGTYSLIKIPGEASSETNVSIMLHARVLWSNACGISTNMDG